MAWTQPPITTTPKKGDVFGQTTNHRSGFSAPKMPRDFAKISHKTVCRNIRKDLQDNLHHPLLVHIQNFPGVMALPGHHPDEDCSQSNVQL